MPTRMTDDPEPFCPNQLHARTDDTKNPTATPTETHTGCIGKPYQNPSLFQ